MQSTSQAQFDAVEHATIPDLELVRPGIWSLPLALPDNHIPFSLCYIVVSTSGAAHLIDPGWNSDDNWLRMTLALDQLGASMSDVASVVSTHLHPDHLGLAERVRAASGASVALHHIEQTALTAMNGNFVPASAEKFEEWGVPQDRRAEMSLARKSADLMPDFVADRLLEDGELLALGELELTVIRTPGHTSGHICLQSRELGLIFTGDHVLPTIFSGLGLGGRSESNPLADYFDALDALATFDDHEVCPGHGYRFFGLNERCEALFEHHLRRSREVAAIIIATPNATVWEVASQISWTDGWHNLQGFYLQSALSQSAMHRQFVATEAGQSRLSTR